MGNTLVVALAAGDFDFAAALDTLKTTVLTNVGIAILAGFAVMGLLYSVRVGIRAFKSIGK